MELGGSAFTVIVSSDDDDGRLTRQLADRWLRDGLFRQFAWVTPGDVDEPAHGPATIQAAVLGSDQRVELMALLGARPRSLIRIVVLHLLTHENADAHRLSTACDQIAGLVKRAMPVSLQNGGPDGTRLLRVNLMVPETDLVPQGSDIIEPGWEVNAIVSPEDRPDLDRLSAFVRRSANLHGHALAAAASVGGLWTGAEVGAFDNRQADSTMGGHEVVVIRCQTRIIVDHDGGSEIATRVAESIQSSPDQVVSWGIPADNPAAVVDACLSRLLSSAEWAPYERVIKPLLKRQVGLGTLSWNWFVFQLQLPIAAIKFMLGFGRNVVEQALTAATVGRDAGAVGRVRPLTPEQAAQVAEFRMKELSDQLKPARLQEEASTWGQATPAAWRDLRRLAIGLVDGSPLPAGTVRAARGGLDEVLPPGYVVPAPADELPLPEHRDIGPLDVEKVGDLAGKLEDTRPTEAEEVGQGPPELDLLEEWVGRRKTSLLWKLATRIGEFRRAERARFHAAQDTLSDIRPPSTRRLKTTQGAVIASWLIALLGLLAFLVWIWSVSQPSPSWIFDQLPKFNWKNTAKLVSFVLAVLVVAGTLYFQALRAYEWQVLQQMFKMRQASDDYVVALQQERRWQLMYQGVQDWGRILSELLHRPWGTSGSQESEELGQYEGLPAAVAVAVPVDSGDGPNPRVISSLAQAICRRGWLEEEFQRLVSESPANDPVSQPHAGDLPADLDLGLRANGSRSDLVRTASNPATKQKARLHLVEEVLDLVGEGQVRLPAQTVRRIGQQATGEILDDRDYLTGSNELEAPLAPDLFEPGALVERLNVPELTVFCLPAGTPPPSLRTAEVHLSDRTTSTRVDVSPLLQPRHIKFFVGKVDVMQYATPQVDDFN